MRTFILMLTAAAMLALSAPAFAASDPLVGSPVKLRASSVIDGDLILLGDLFDNVGGLATKPVAYAPEPGRQATYGARWLYQIARHFKLDWQPMSTRDVTVIERASQIVTREEIEQEILYALGETALGGDISVELGNRTLKLHLPTDSFGGIEITDLDYDALSGRLTAIVAAPAGDPLAQKVRVAGSVRQVVEIPVPARHIPRGELISAKDVEWLKVDATKIARDTITSIDELIGMAPRRGLRVGTPVRMVEVVAPELVAKNSLVTISIEHSTMRLTAQGKALDSGARGEVIRVLNTRSNNIVEAEVIGAGQAVVRIATIVAMN